MGENTRREYDRFDRFSDRYNPLSGEVQMRIAEGNLSHLLNCTVYCTFYSPSCSSVIIFGLFSGNNPEETYYGKFTVWQKPREEHDDQEEGGTVLFYSSPLCFSLMNCSFVIPSFFDMQTLGKRTSRHWGEMPKRIRGKQGEAMMTRPTLRVSNYFHLLPIFFEWFQTCVIAEE